MNLLFAEGSEGMVPGKGRVREGKGGSQWEGSGIGRLHGLGTCVFDRLGRLQNDGGVYVCMYVCMCVCVCG